MPVSPPPSGVTLKRKRHTFTNTIKLTEADLNQFTGSETWYRHVVNRNVLFTDGAKYVSDHAGAYWLLDEITIIQPHDKRIAAEEFQVWKLVVHPDRTATLTCGDGNDNIVFTKENIENTDFPLDEISLWFANNVIYQPSEHWIGEPAAAIRRGLIAGAWTLARVSAGPYPSKCVEREPQQLAQRNIPVIRQFVELPDGLGSCFGFELLIAAGPGMRCAAQALEPVAQFDPALPLAIRAVKGGVRIKRLFGVRSEFSRALVAVSEGFAFNEVFRDHTDRNAKE